MPRRIGIIPHLYARPLFTGLTSGVPSSIDVIEGPSAQLAIELRKKELDVAFLSPIDFAKDYAMYRVVPGLAVASEGSSAATELLFHTNLQKIKTIGVDPGYPSEIVLTRLILAEKYDITPSFVPVVSVNEHTFQSVDAMLVVGQTSEVMSGVSSRIDMVDEWSDMSELPYVHGFWVLREGSLVASEIDELRNSAQAGSGWVAAQSEPVRNYLDHFQYDLDENALSGLKEFLRMGYYHGVLPDVPDVHFYRPDGHPLHSEGSIH